MFRNNQRGMTLIEILIVLSIIGSMAAFLFRTVFSNLTKSEVSETKIVMGQVAQALQLYYVDCRGYPSSLDGLVENTGNECSNWGPDPYLPKYPKDAWNKELEYEVDGSKYILRSLGKDRKPGGTGSDADITSEDLEK